MGFGTVLASLVSIVLAIAIVAALAFGFIYLLRLWQDRSMGAAEQRGSGPGMSFMRALPLGQAERLVLVEVGDEVLLVGVAAHAITLLKSWPKSELAATDPMSSGAMGRQQGSAVSELVARFQGVPGLRGRRAEPNG